MKWISLRIALAVFGLLLSVVSGCGSGSGAVPVEGTLTYQGQPVPGVMIQFVPVAGGRPSTGLSDANGHFALRYTKDETGTPVGKYNVTFNWIAASEDDKETDAIKAILEKHGEGKTPVQVEITGPTKDLKVAVE